MARVTIEGLRQARAELEELRKRATPKAFAPALRKGLEVIADEVRKLIPVETGFLKSQVQIVEKVQDNKISMYVHIGSEDWYIGKAFYGAFQEFGTSKMHGKAFMRRAWDAKHAEAERVATREIQNILGRLI